MRSLIASVADTPDLFKDLQKPQAGGSGLGLFFTLTGVFILLFLLWAIFFRKPKDERARRYSYSDESRSSRSSSGGAEGGEGEGRHKGKRRRRRHRRRNPTLAETGGLPPPRSDFPSGDPP